MTRDIIIYMITIILAFISLFIGITSNFFGIFEDNQISIVLGSFSISLLIVLIGDRITYGLDNNQQKEEVNQILRDWKKDVPILNTSISEFASSNAAMEYLCLKITQANQILNTKISKDAVPPDFDVADKYITSLKRALDNGLIYKDVVSSGFKDYADQIFEYSQSCKGDYKYNISDVNLPCFINFIILIFPNGEKELLTGWVTSKYFGMEQAAYKITDRRLINLFEKYHYSLFVENDN